MSENIESAELEKQKPSAETRAEFANLVNNLTRGGWINRDAMGKKLDRERDYFLPDGRTMQAVRLLDKEYDTGVLLVLSESAISQDGKPYTLKYSYYVMDYGGTNRFFVGEDEFYEQQQKFHSNFLSITPEQAAEEKRLRLDLESQEHKWDLESKGLADDTISEDELRSLIDEISSLQKTGKLEPLPNKDVPEYGHPEFKRKVKQEIPIEPIEGAIKAAKSLLYNTELKSAEPVKPQTVSEIKDFIKAAVKEGEVVWEEPDYMSDPELSFRRRRLRLVDDREAEVRKYYSPRDDISTDSLVAITEKKDNKFGQPYEIEEKYWILKNGDLQLDMIPKDKPEDEEDYFEDEEAAENASKNSRLAYKMNLHTVSEQEANKLLRLLRTAETIQ